MGLAACEAMDAYSRADYASVVESLLPWEWQLSGLGGSTVQRDVITQLLIHATVRSEFSLLMGLLIGLLENCHFVE